MLTLLEEESSPAVAQIIWTNHIEVWEPRLLFGSVGYVHHHLQTLMSLGSQVFWCRYEELARKYGVALEWDGLDAQIKVADDDSSAESAKESKTQNGKVIEHAALEAVEQKLMVAQARWAEQWCNEHGTVFQNLLALSHSSRLTTAHID